MDLQSVKSAALRYPELVELPYSNMIDMNGFDAICVFIEHFSGETVYIPKLRTVFAACIEKDVLRRYNGRNIRKLADQFGYSLHQIRLIIRRNSKKT